MGQEFLGRFDIVEMLPPYDSQSGAQTADRIHLRNAKHLTLVYHKAAGVAGDDPTVTLLQANAVTGGTTKALTFTKIYRKEAVGLTAVTNWTKTTQAAANTYTNATSAESNAVWVIEIDPASLDQAGGFEWVTVTIADTGSAGTQPNSMLAIIEQKYVTDPTVTPSAIS